MEKVPRVCPWCFHYDNLIMGAMLMEYARQFEVDKFMAIGTICAYPKFTSVPFKEENLWDGYPERDQCSLRISQEDGVGTVSGLSCPIWI